MPRTRREAIHTSATQAQRQAQASCRDAYPLIGYADRGLGRVTQQILEDRGLHVYLVGGTASAGVCYQRNKAGPLLTARLQAGQQHVQNDESTVAVKA